MFRRLRSASQNRSQDSVRRRRAFFRPQLERVEERTLFAAMVFNVTTTVDELTANGQTSLREAIQLANTNPGTDTINIPAGTYQLTLTGNGEDGNQTGDLDITESVNINGAGEGATFIQAGTRSWNEAGGADGTDRIFHYLSVDNEIDSTIQDLTVQFGNIVTGFSTSGGGINFSNQGDLTLTRVTVFGNQTRGNGGGLVFFGDELTINDSSIVGNHTLEGDGGGFEFSGGAAEVSDSTISGNIAGFIEGGGDGGGIDAFGDLTVRRTTISNNHAEDQGGGIAANTFNEGNFLITVIDSTISGNIADEDGGGIFLRGANANIANSTISGNKADIASGEGGGIYDEDLETPSTVVLLNVTVTLNLAFEGSGLWYQGIVGASEFRVGNTIVAANDDSAVNSDVFGNFISNGNNLIGVGEGSTGFTNGVNNDQVGTTGNPRAPGITPLQDNGGPTFTHALVTGSFAINNGNNALANAGGLTFDQRGTGFDRISDTTVDIGAFEVQVAPPVLGVIVVSADDGALSKPFVKILDTSGNAVTSFLAYEASYRGGVRVAVGDVTGDGIPEIITAPGRGHSPLIKVFTSAGVELRQFRFFAYAQNFNGGVQVAVGDVLGDGLADIIVGNSRGVAEVRVFQNKFNSSSDPISDKPARKIHPFGANFIGGVTVAAGNITGGASSRDEVIVGSGPGIASAVKIYDVTETVSLKKVIHPFVAKFHGGVFVAAGDANGDGLDELVVSTGQGGGSLVKIYGGATGKVIHTFTAYEGKSKQAAVHIAVVDLDGNGTFEGILTAQANDGRVHKVKYVPMLNPEAVDLVVLEDPEFAGGVYLG